MLTKMTMRSLHDDLDISVLIVTPDQEPKAVLQIAHGICGCKERFIPFMEYMAAPVIIEAMEQALSLLTISDICMMEVIMHL